MATKNEIIKTKDKFYHSDGTELELVNSLEDINPGSSIYIDFNGTISLQLFRDKLYSESDEQYEDYLKFFIGHFIKIKCIYKPILKEIEVNIDNTVIEEPDLDF